MIEGPCTDAIAPNQYRRTTCTPLGDADDVLMFTARSRGEPFVGKYCTRHRHSRRLIESQPAEVMYSACRMGR